MAKQSNDVIKFLIIVFVIFIVLLLGYEYFQFGSLFNNTEHYRKIYQNALEQKKQEQYSQAYQTLQSISPRYEAYDAVLYQQALFATQTGNEMLVQKALSALVSKYPQSQLYLQAKYDLGKSYMRSKTFDSAAKIFENIINSHPNTDFETGSYYYLSEINASKNKPAQEKYLKKYISQSQDGRFSLEALQTLIDLKAKFADEDKFYAGVTLLKAQKYDEALKYFNNTNYPKDWYYKAKTLSALKKNEEAKKVIKEGLQQNIKELSQEEVSDIMYLYANISSSKSTAWDELCDIVLSQKNMEDIALYNKAKYLPKDRAMILYKKIVDNHIKGDYASESLWYLFFDAYKNQNYDVAKSLANKHINNFTGAKSSAKINFWLGKIYEKEGDKELAIKAYQRVMAKYPDDYYAFRSNGRIHAIKKGVDIAWNTSPNNTLKTDFELQLPYTYSEIKNKYGATLAELLMVGDYDTIDMMYNFKEPFIESWILYQKGLRSKSTVIARDAIDTMQDKPEKFDLRYKCAYPIHYADIINEYSKNNKLDAYLVISIIREESYFNNLALSGSNAVGLMQLLPSTAAEVAQRNRYGKINEFLLFNPQTNIKFGTKYFSQIKTQLRGNAMYAVAAYNGGAGSVQKWLNKNEDPDEMIENIPYEETQNYVRKIFRSYWNYLRIYKGI